MTPDRFQRIHQVLATRQPDLTVCMEEVHKPNNVSAIIRTADAVGVHKVHAVWPKEAMKVLSHTSAGARNWVELETHDTMINAISALKAQGMQVLATNLSTTAVDFRDVDYTKPTAIILGGEKNGITAEALALADQDIIIPMVGMVQSLNVSVASALILYEAQRQRQNAGMYDRTTTLLDDSVVNRILFERGHPVLANVAKQKKLPYPQLDDQGQIIADEQWWAAMQAKKIKRPVVTSEIKKD
ncbi:tRNA (guanosine(18)-2'-O)-methyltransferase TrmH [Photobacterium phosphoreum]|jgi:tRNA (guanosine-2'-O-)-methyltransferase|uniref:tRNA (guanosine(18)-2'-O)-methyltransferase TrmH n=1 Tax=Photobacterium phosphoreum TaxID=659 RepID=UPI0005D32AC6|nr:tRNA (guanosine(18)-2'-O)-methyltransferase TrmH [Photobacterium phosphoreum]KJF85103.1 tRNA guanosine-2'-O-methyltransferase [Photobacterium phosphoreum]MCD9463544.1 tRNA (guanosine(18)-2'-O)-methyltransferase TrmH [Photobacterium phosphoreum]MCD9471403.1 tRNA (guanosine(18)-2'-O)-methyltransferase TrmH [Photobacterium phosphoreum]MCD9476740.1 tRNA (guanosine(18)-2'-O)-methyltransferase TrmH [Photobacterium phosphoreum]MCD9507010.1 tRNA (guanosine(18)-2'-O)-methyltransferase TrmH [Photobac